MFISDINIEDFVAHRFYKRRGKTRCRSKILEAHANVKDLNLIESKMNFIKVRFFYENLFGDVTSFVIGG
jgi:hypothetical protein